MRKKPENLLGRLLRGDEGQDLVEYALLTALVSLSVVAGLTAVGVSLEGWYASIAGIFGKSNCAPTGIAASGGKCL